jgi:hypothetical protein
VRRVANFAQDIGAASLQSAPFIIVKKTTPRAVDQRCQYIRGTDTVQCTVSWPLRAVRLNAENLT